MNFGVQSGLDPADAMFNTTNFPDASTNNLTDLRALYAFLTGRVTAINGTARLNPDSKYVYIGPTTDDMLLKEFGAYAQDSWRVTPALTLNAGVRWELQLPITRGTRTTRRRPIADICGPSGPGSGPGDRNCNLFQPGVFGAPGMQPQYTQYTANTAGYKTDWNNFAPNLSVAWRPNVQSGLLRTLLGDPEQATLRAGYAVAFNRNGMAEFENIYGGNPGRSITANRTNGIGNLVPAGRHLAAALSRDEPARSAADVCERAARWAAFPEAPVYPMLATTATNVNIFDPEIQLSYTNSFQVGFQRALSPNMAIEIRYVGTQNRNGWTTENWNEVNIYENGFLDEFKLAQANLRSHVAAGCGTAGQAACSLPIGDLAPARRRSPSTWRISTRSTRTTPATPRSTPARTGRTRPSSAVSTRSNRPSNSASNDLFGSATFRTNMATAGLPANFWVLNPLIDDANVRRSVTSTQYHSMQTRSPPPAGAAACS